MIHCQLISPLFEFEVGFDHKVDQLLKAGARLPAQNRSDLTDIGLRAMAVLGPVEAGVEAYMGLPVEVGIIKRGGHKRLDRIHLTAADDKIISLGLLQHQPHRFHIIGRVTPVASGV